MWIELTLYAGESQLLCDILLPEFPEQTAGETVETNAELVEQPRTEDVSIAQRRVAPDRLEVNGSIVRQGCSRIDLIGVLPGKAAEHVLFIRYAVIHPAGD